jgi:hypothetical protein
MRYDEGGGKSGPGQPPGHRQTAQALAASGSAICTTRELGLGGIEVRMARQPRARRPRAQANQAASTFFRAEAAACASRNPTEHVPIVMPTQRITLARLRHHLPRRDSGFAFVSGRALVDFRLST